MVETFFVEKQLEGSISLSSAPDFEIIVKKTVIVKSVRFSVAFCLSVNLVCCKMKYLCNSIHT